LGIIGFGENVRLLVVSFIFKLEEVNLFLLLLLPIVFAETVVFGSAFSLGCWLVVAIAQA
jgi:hypothetical protein